MPFFVYAFLGRAAEHPEPHVAPDLVLEKTFLMAPPIQSKKNTSMSLFVKKIFDKLHASHQSWKKQMFQYKSLKIN